MGLFLILSATQSALSGHRHLPSHQLCAFTHFHLTEQRWDRTEPKGASRSDMWHQNSHLASPGIIPALKVGVRAIGCEGADAQPRLCEGLHPLNPGTLSQSSVTVLSQVCRTSCILLMFAELNQLVNHPLNPAFLSVTTSCSSGVSW